MDLDFTYSLWQSPSLIIVSVASVILLTVFSVPLVRELFSRAITPAQRQIAFPTDLVGGLTAAVVISVFFVLAGSTLGVAQSNHLNARSDLRAGVEEVYGLSLSDGALQELLAAEGSGRFPVPEVADGERVVAGSTLVELPAGEVLRAELVWTGSEWLLVEVNGSELLRR